MKIQVGTLSQGEHTYTFQAPAADIGLGSEFPEDVRVTVSLEKTSSEIMLKARLQISGTFACDRCVARFSLSLSPSYRMYYVWDHASSQGLDPSEVQVVQPGLSVIDISDDVRQTILLAVPLKLLCREDCRGLCAGCGVNLNSEACRCEAAGTDQRWDSLRSLGTT